MNMKSITFAFAIIFSFSLCFTAQAQRQNLYQKMMTAVSGQPDPFYITRDMISVDAVNAMLSRTNDSIFGEPAESISAKFNSIGFMKFQTFDFEGGYAYITIVGPGSYGGVTNSLCLTIEVTKRSPNEYILGLESGYNSLYISGKGNVQEGLLIKGEISKEEGEYGHGRSVLYGYADKELWRAISQTILDPVVEKILSGNDKASAQ